MSRGASSTLRRHEQRRRACRDVEHCDGGGVAGGLRERGRNGAWTPGAVVFAPRRCRGRFLIGRRRCAKTPGNCGRSAPRHRRDAIRKGRRRRGRSPPRQGTGAPRRPVASLRPKRIALGGAHSNRCPREERRTPRRLGTRRLAKGRHVAIPGASWVIAALPPGAAQQHAAADKAARLASGAQGGGALARERIRASARGAAAGGIVGRNVSSRPPCS